MILGNSVRLKGHLVKSNRFDQNILSKNDAKKFWKVPVLFALFLYD